MVGIYPLAIDKGIFVMILDRTTHMPVSRSQDPRVLSDQILALDFAPGAINLESEYIAGIVVCHVDDIFWGGYPIFWDTLTSAIIDLGGEVQELRTGDKAQFLGRMIFLHADTIVESLTDYAMGIRPISATDAIVSAKRRTNERSAFRRKQIKCFVRACIGELLWLSKVSWFVLAEVGGAASTWGKLDGRALKEGAGVWEEPEVVAEVEDLCQGLNLLIAEVQSNPELSQLEFSPVPLENKVMEKNGSESVQFLKESHCELE